jgi:hypothetical protein
MSTLTRIVSPSVPASLAEPVAKARDFIEASVPENTRRAYASDWALFTEWCEEKGVCALPASAAVIAAFAADESKGSKPSTLRRRMAAIRGVSPAVDPVADDAALGATRATLDALAGELALCLRYFGVTFRGGQPSRVILSGTDAAEPRLAGILEEACRTSVVSFESELPSAFASSALDAFRSDDGLAPWTGAFGLACRSRLLKEARTPLATNAGERAA